MILTEIGEIGVHAGDSTYLLRPSLYAMSQLGPPTEIVNLFSAVMSDYEEDSALNEQFMLALGVIHSCCDADLSDVFGYFDDQLKYVHGQVEVDHVLPLARCLLKHGLIGIDPTESKEEPASDYTPKFEARKHVAAAMAHLGLSEKDAWSITMTSLIGAIKSKYPQREEDKKPKVPSLAEYNETMAWFEKVEEARNRRQGAH